MFISKWEMNLVENVYGKIVERNLSLKREKKKSTKLCTSRTDTFGYHRRLLLPVCDMSSEDVGTVLSGLFLLLLQRTTEGFY